MMSASRRGFVRYSSTQRQLRKLEHRIERSDKDSRPCEGNAKRCSASARFGHWTVAVSSGRHGAAPHCDRVFGCQIDGAQVQVLL
jgi:hypothetical protein